MKSREDKSRREKESKSQKQEITGAQNARKVVKKCVKLFAGWEGQKVGSLQRRAPGHPLR